MLIHRNAKLWAMAAMLLFGVVLVSPSAKAVDETCEVPLFIKQNSGGANVMIMADNSGSMNEATYHDAYDPDRRYSGTFYTNSSYYVNRDGWYNPKAFYYRWATSPYVYLVNSDNGQSGRYMGNYLNWLFYHANDTQRSDAPRVTRIQVLKTVLDQIVARSAQLDMGLTVFRSDNHGGKILSECGADHASIRSQIAGITANTWTPLGETLETVLNYFGSNNDSPIENSCQYNFILMVTDGLPTMDRGVSYYLHDADHDGRDPGNCDSIGAPYPNSNDCSDHVDDVAYWLANEDIAGHIDEDQHVYTYVVGYNEDSQLLEDTATNGQGLYFTANNAVDLFASIEYALQDILRRISAGSAVAVVSTERGTDDRLYRGKFMPVDWHGFLESYELPYEDNDHAVWEAGSILQSRSPGSRDIFTAINRNMYSFTESFSATLMEKMGAANEEEAARLIAWGRGEDVDGLRNRQGWVLGDIIHSTPVVVGPPSEFLMDESYTQFRQAHEYRRKMIYVGANDGMIHSFDAETGHEAWAFVPEFALPKFVDMADSSYCHLYTCDQTVTVKDVKVNGNWRTVLVAGGGGGGASIFALDITYPDHPEVLWQKNLGNGKKHHSEVQIASIGGQSVALVGSGLDTENKRKAFLYGFDISTGTKLGKVLLSKDKNALRNKASKPATVDVNLDGETDLVYVADLFGTLYRIEVDGDANLDNWEAEPLYVGDQEIQADPVAAHGPNGAVYVYFGTGAFIDDEDMTDYVQNSFLCVFDQHNDSVATKNQMANQTNDIDEVSGYMGWYVNLWNEERERVTQKAAVVAETVIFTSFAPNPDACVAGGTSYLYQMRYDDGGIPDVDYMEDEEDRSSSLGDGVASHPVVDLSEGTVVVQSSDASISVVPIAGIIERLRVRSWQENYDHVEDVSIADPNG